MRSVPSGTTIELTTRPPDAATAASDRRRSRRAARRSSVAERVAADPHGDAACRRRRTASCACVSTSTGDAPLLVAPAAAVLAEHGSALADVKLGTPTLEDVFIHLTGRTLR